MVLRFFKSSHQMVPSVTILRSLALIVLSKIFVFKIPYYRRMLGRFALAFLLRDGLVVSPAKLIGAACLGFLTMVGETSLFVFVASARASISALIYHLDNSQRFFRCVCEFQACFPLINAPTFAISSLETGLRTASRHRNPSHSSSTAR